MVARSVMPLPSRIGISCRDKIHILDAQTQRFHQSHTAGCTLARVRFGAVPGPNVLLQRSKPRQPLWLLGPHDIGKPGQIDCQHFFIKKQQSRQRLVLRGCRYITCYSELSKKGLDFLSAHLLWVAILMKTNKTLYPFTIDAFSTNGVMFEPNVITHLSSKRGFPSMVHILPNRSS